jgi:hypothetical protein
MKKEKVINSKGYDRKININDAMVINSKGYDRKININDAMVL